MLKLQTPVDCGKSRIQISYKDRILIIGSCFADNIGWKMSALGFDVCVNPFGTLYNPQSIAGAIRRLRECMEFTPGDCEQMGSGAGLICSFSHHTSFARKSREEFLENANRRLHEASEFYRTCNKVIMTLGTTWCYRHIASGLVVSNCLKRDAREFERERMEPEDTVRVLSGIIATGKEGGSIGGNNDSGSNFSDNSNGGNNDSGGNGSDNSIGGGNGRSFILTVSPIRHFKDGAHGNQVSKASLLIAADRLCSIFHDRCEYFPSYEIMMDELRDYRFYAEDMLHPSDQAVGYIWDRFCDFALPEEDRGRLAAEEKRLRQSLHRPIPRE